MAVGFPTKANWAAGDVLTASAQDDLAGTVNLLSNASAASGSQLVSNVAGTSFAYQATPSASNPVLNSAMNVWQRGTSFTPASTTKTYTADRWCAFRTATGLTVSRQATGDTTNLPFIQYASRISRDSGTTSTATPYFIQAIETVNTIPFAGKTVTVSFYARKGANFSATSNILGLQVYTGTGTDQDPTSFAYTGSSLILDGTYTLTTTWQRFTSTISVGSTATEMAFYFKYDPTGTAGAADYYEVTGVQMDIGSVALPFRTYAATYQGELAACQRYYWRSHTNSTYDNFALGYGKVGSTTIAQVPVPLKVTMRTAPSSVDYANLYLYDGSTNPSVSAVAFAGLTTTPDSAFVEATSAVLVASKPYVLNSGTSTSSYIGFSAEL